MKDHSTQHTERRGVAFVQDAVHSAEWIFREHKEVDHGIDAHMESIVDDRVSGRLIALQIKSGPNFFQEEVENGFVFRGDQDHLNYWLEHSLPVLLLLVDLTNRKIHWVQVTPQAITSTGKGWKIIVPKTKVLNSDALKELAQIAINLRISRPFSILQLDDISHSEAKRYSAHIQLNSDYPKDYIKSLASEITKQISLETWQKHPQFEPHFKGRPADVVWLYMCRTVDDSKQANWLCRTQWISPALSENSRPMQLKDEKPGEIAFEWPDTRHSMEEFALSHELTKSQAVTVISKTINEIDTHLNRHRRDIEAFINAPNPKHSCIDGLRVAACEAHELYLRSGNSKLPPFELADLMTALSSVIASYDNAFMLFNEPLDSDKNTKRAAILTRQALQMYDQDLTLFREEARRRNINT